MVGCLPFGVSTGPRIQDLSGIQDLPSVGCGPLVVCSLLSSALLLMLVVSLANMALFRVFRGF